MTINNHSSTATSILTIILIFVVCASTVPVPHRNGFDSFTQRTIITNHGSSAQSRITFGHGLQSSSTQDIIEPLRPFNTKSRYGGDTQNLERYARRLYFQQGSNNNVYAVQPIYPIPGFGRAIEAVETMAPRGVFLPPESSLDLNVLDPNHRPDFSNGLEHPDPFLLTGEAAKRAVAYLSKKELFFHEFPHAEALLRNNLERRENGLPENYLSSSRHSSPFYRYGYNHL